MGGDRIHNEQIFGTKTETNAQWCSSALAYSNELPYEYMLALRTTALTQTDRKSFQRVRDRPKRPKTDTESNIFHRIGFI